ncbi:unnamed protein product [Rangifer tarandus platyrhynchus]|uniref:Uncharacterized protein n=2 Tax=Rangifer tarandus platyrhynchus TaxID=3082113 RepID=A0ABN8YMJ6_RANTA|nr:unnamed protein product [Rangifer tarandus platyrhynchus]CAI9696817.1 unnamed protein product [Rangifer tarandus platyrhynchus]
MLPSSCTPGESRSFECSPHTKKAMRPPGSSHLGGHNAQVAAGEVALRGTLTCLRAQASPPAAPGSRRRGDPPYPDPLTEQKTTVTPGLLEVWRLRPFLSPPPSPLGA